MSETAEQMSARWQNEATALATQHVDLAADTMGINLDQGARRECVELGISAGYLAAMQLLVREGLLPTEARP